MQPLTPFTSSQVPLVLLCGVPTTSIMKSTGQLVLWDRQMEAEAVRQTTPTLTSVLIRGATIADTKSLVRLLDLENRAFFPQILLVQYIPDDFLSPRDIAVKPDRSIILSLFKTFSTFNVLGVTHNSGNILFNPRNAPTHAVIDFGHAEYRESELDQGWDKILKESGDVHALKRLLRWKGWGFEDPA